MNWLRRAVVAWIALVGTIASNASAGDSPPCFWLAFGPQSPQPTDLEHIANSAKLISDAQDGPWLEQLIGAAVKLAAMDVPAEISVSRWPDGERADSAQWSLRVEVGDIPAAAELLGRALPLGPQLAWSLKDGVLIVAIGPEAAERVKNFPRPAGVEVDAHRAAAGVPANQTGPIALFIDLNAIRRQAPEAMALGPEARLLDLAGVSNARALGIWTRLNPQPEGGPVKSMLTAEITWSARSRPPGAVAHATVGESTFPAKLTDFVWSASWVFASRTDAGANLLARGWGGLIRQGAAMALAGEPGLSPAADGRVDRQQRWFMSNSDPLRAITSRLDVWVVVAPRKDRTLAVVAPTREAGQDGPMVESASLLTKGLAAATASAGEVTLRWSRMGLTVKFKAEFPAGVGLILKAE